MSAPPDFNASAAFLARSVRNAASAGLLFSTWYVVEMFTVWSQAALSKAPMPFGDVLVARLREPGLPHEDVVLEHPCADLVEVDDVELGRRVKLAGFWVLLFEHLRVLVVDHGLRRIDLAVQKKRHVERLGHDGDVARLGRIDPDLAHRGVELGLVPEAPRPDLLALPVFGLGDVLVLERDLERARALEDLGDIHEVRSRFT